MAGRPFKPLFGCCEAAGNHFMITSTREVLPQPYTRDIFLPPLEVLATANAWLNAWETQLQQDARRQHGELRGKGGHPESRRDGARNGKQTPKPAGGAKPDSMQVQIGCLWRTHTTVQSKESTTTPRACGLAFEKNSLGSSVMQVSVKAPHVVLSEFSCPVASVSASSASFHRPSSSMRLVQST